MKNYLLVFLVFATSAFAQVTPDQIEMARVKCELIKCDDLVAQEYYRCRVQEKSCFKRVFELNMQIWQSSGVSQKQRSSILQTLEQSKKSHQQLISRLNEEIKLAREEMSEIDLQIESVKKLKGPR